MALCLSKKKDPAKSSRLISLFTTTFQFPTYFSERKSLSQDIAYWYINKDTELNRRCNNLTLLHADSLKFREL